MKRLFSSVALAGLLGVLMFGVSQAAAQQDQPQPQRQGRGNFDPAQMQQRMLERMKEQLAVTNDDEWKIISERLVKVMEARQAGGGMRGGMGMMGPGRQGGPGGPGGQRGGFGTPNPEAEALQKALEGQASTQEIKEKLAKLRESRKAREEQVAKAQEELRKVLTTKQEATLVLMGMLQ